LWEPFLGNVIGREMAEEGKWKSKLEARAEARRRLSSLSESSMAERQFQLNSHLSKFLLEHSGSWGAYQPMAIEASPLPSIANSKHIRWVYPRVRDQVLDFYLEPKIWLKGPFGIAEPDPAQSELVNIQALNGYLVPGLGFDQKGARIGRGRGFFDRALQNFKGLKVGLAFDVQVLESPLPMESFDIPMDVLITDRGVFYTHIEGDRRND
jgi:5-formyltetrahydrofolate cyclo-ligase